MFGGCEKRAVGVAAGKWMLVALAASVLAACSSRSLNPAPVEDRGNATRPTATAKPGPAPVASTEPAMGTMPANAPAGSENAGKPGYYTVKPGDTLIRIGLDNGQSWKDIVRWSNVENPNKIEVGQVLRVLPPVAGASATGPATSRPVASSGGASGTPLPAAGASAASSAGTPKTASTAPGSEDDIAWIWPTPGGVIAAFDESKNRGIDLDGKAGDPVLAAADGTVVYVGAAIRGMGNLVILKHNNAYITAYAHNQTLLVKDDQAVKKGQKIAEMGNSDADRVKLHFELRRQGKPVDPAKYLPPR